MLWTYAFTIPSSMIFSYDVYSSERTIRAARRSGTNPFPELHHIRLLIPSATFAKTNSHAQIGSKGESTPKNDHPVPKRHRKNSPSSATPQPNHTSEPSATPRQSNSKVAKSRPPISATAPTRTTTAALREEARQSRVTSPVKRNEPVSPENKLDPIAPIPRLGMGEVYPSPPESDIRTEAKFIIQAAARHREQGRLRLRKLRRASYRNERKKVESRITPPPTGRPAHHPVLHLANGHSNATSVYASPGSPEEDYPVELYFATAGPSCYIAQSGQTSSSTERKHSESSAKSSNTLSFGEKCTAVPVYCDDLDPSDPLACRRQPSQPPLTVESNIITEEAKSGLSHHGARQPKVILHLPGENRVKARDKEESAHQEGLEGLTMELEADAVGLVENVRVSLVDACSGRADAYFPFSLCFFLLSF